ncbi:CPBP family intramembrane glutamic endopeptidase [Streptococcus cuniculi]|uniref:CPBP family intramembrane metalloprotease n=1 Tax=Streptococcus cuniculi TaxID=1432788 RepID=A0A4Y9J8E8_9STRE|nr:type II CAAX endopeptidase family protein [Streptococcus cuniculi]MBF0778800.1 CPBP family intramembrane metalloprotease [Streptococcus cuniculi]TFU97300.1 CPBP family intramembrane metalloprotease [Streptococcus cuniculi]
MKKTFWNMLKVVGSLVLVFIINRPLTYLISHQKSLTAWTAWGASLLYLLAVLGLILWLWRVYRTETVANSLRLKDVGIALLFGLLARLVAIIGTLLILLTSGQETSANDTVLFGIAAELKDGFFPIAVLFLLYTALIAPVVEELIFRGLFIELLFKNGPKWLAWLLSSAVFAGLHLHSVAPMEFLLYFALASVLYLSYARRGEIKDSILVHILNNALPSLVFAFQIFF